MGVVFLINFFISFIIISSYIVWKLQNTVNDICRNKTDERLD